MRVVIEDKLGPGDEVVVVKTYWGEYRVVNAENLERIFELTGGRARIVEEELGKRPGSKLSDMLRRIGSPGKKVFEGSFEDFLRWLRECCPNDEVEDLPRGVTMPVRDWLRLVSQESSAAVPA